MYPNGITITNTYDSLNRLTSTTSKKPDGTTVIMGEYKYDAAGNVRYILQETAENRQIMEISYDNFDRMVKELKKDDSGETYSQDYDWNYTYDDADNLIEWNYYVNISTVNARHLVHGLKIEKINALNQITEVSDLLSEVVGNRYTYDEMGNLQKDEFIAHLAPEEHRYQNPINYMFDGFGRMRKIEGNGKVIEYEYDYRGRLMRRVERELPDGENVETARMSYSGGTSVLEKNVENTLRFYRGSDMGGGVGGLLYADDADSSGLNYKHYNLRGDIVATTDSGGSILSERQYVGNGSVFYSSGTQPADKFMNNTKRVEDGFVNEGRRYRYLKLMRFISPDPLEYIDGLNCYAYCGNNPWGRFDPYGLAEKKGYIKAEKNSGGKTPNEPSKDNKITFSGKVEIESKSGENKETITIGGSTTVDGNKSTGEAKYKIESGKIEKTVEGKISNDNGNVKAEGTLGVKVNNKSNNTSENGNSYEVNIKGSYGNNSSNGGSSWSAEVNFKIKNDNSSIESYIKFENENGNSNVEVGLKYNVRF